MSGSTILIVPKDSLPRLPEAFQQYVRDYFVERKVFGKPCMVAFRVHNLKKPRRKGAAPGHLSILDKYKLGLDGMHLLDWMVAEANGGDIFSHSGTWEEDD